MPLVDPNPGLLKDRTLNHFVTRDTWSSGGAPSVNDDETLGYSIGSKWRYAQGVDEYADYVCYDATDGSAVWICEKVVSTNSPSNTDDDSLGFRKGSEWISHGADRFYLCTDPTTGFATWSAH